MTAESLLMELAGNRILTPEAMENYTFTTKPGALQVVSSAAS